MASVSEQFNIDTKGICLLCYQDCIQSKSTCENFTPARRSTSLKLLMRYLKIKPGNFLKTPSVPMMAIMDSLENIEVMASLCENCGLATRKFCELYQEFEGIRLKMDGCVQSLCCLMKNGDNDKHRSREYQRRISGCSVQELMNVLIGDSLRRETLEKCLLKMNVSQPKVALRRDPPEDSNINSNLEPIARNAFSTVPEFPILGGSNEDEKKSDIIISELERPVELESSLDPNGAVTTEELNEPVGFQSTQEETLEQLEPMEFLSGVTIKVEDSSVLGINVINDPLAPPTSSSGPSIVSCASKAFKCSECGKSFSTKASLWGHLGSHRSRNNVAIKTRSTTSSAFCESLPSNNGVQKWKCKMCGKKFVSRNSLKRHSVVHTGERPFSCAHCGHSSALYFNHRKHLIVVHPMEVFSKYLPEGTTRPELDRAIKSILEEQSIVTNDQAKPVGCPYCSSRFRDKFLFRTHILERHFDKLVIQLQNEMINRGASGFC